jgi:hypothetical protein
LATGNSGKYIAARKSTEWAKSIAVSRPKKLAEAMKTYNIKIPEMNKFNDMREFFDSLSEQQTAKLFDSPKEQ